MLRKPLLVVLLCLSLFFGGCGATPELVFPESFWPASATPAETTTPEAAESIPVINNRPFPQALDFENCIKPDGVTQEQMNESIRTCFESWKKAYVKESNGTTPGGGYYVEMKGTGGTGNEKTTSEAHGYGMIIFALMAGYDKDAKTYFDGMYNMYDNHRSTIKKDNMSWIIDKSELKSKDSDSATDGDMDISYALLLANSQWGSEGKINYLQEARRMITKGIKEGDMSVETKRTMLGDWDRNKYSTRASDWMPDHFRAYFNATDDDFWNEATTTVYELISSMTVNYSPTTGLMSDFIVENPPKPAPPKFLEGTTDGDYSWNSCRYPWRIATDYAHYNTPEAKEACNKIINWLKDETDKNPSRIVAGYNLAGEKLVNYYSVCFAAPFMAASIVDESHQEYLDQGWSLLTKTKQGYYADSIALLCMLLISGNWWPPV